MDDLMVMGCSGFVFASVAIYLLTLWPYFVFQRTDRLQVLALCSAIGFVPAAVLGMICSRRFGLAGACGFFASAIATGIFIYLRVDQIFLAAQAKQIPEPDYPQIVGSLLPVGWGLLVLILAILLLPKDETRDIESLLSKQGR